MPAGSAALRARSSGGYTMVEVVIAALIISIAVTSILGVTLTARTQLKHGNMREQMNQQSRRLIEDLRAYVRPSTWGNLPSDYAWGVVGPGRNADGSMTGSNGWQFPNDNCGGCNWALAAGGHDVTNWLPPAVRAAGGKLTYAVNANTSGRSISVTETWTE